MNILQKDASEMYKSNVYIEYNIYNMLSYKYCSIRKQYSHPRYKAIFITARVFYSCNLHLVKFIISIILLYLNKQIIFQFGNICSYMFKLYFINIFLQIAVTFYNTIDFYLFIKSQQTIFFFKSNWFRQSFNSFKSE